MYCSGMFIFSFHAYGGDLALNELRDLSELQSGSDDLAVVELGEARNSLAMIEQVNGIYGKGNAAKISQQGNHNNAYIKQEGNGNRALIDQNGNDNTAAILQYGYYNDGYILQDGNNNDAYIVQRGQYIEYSISQQGDNNTAYLMDKRGVNNSSYSVNQSGSELIILVNGMNRNISIN